MRLPGLGKGRSKRPVSYVSMQLFANTRGDLEERKLIRSHGSLKDFTSAVAVVDAAFELLARRRIQSALNTHDINQTAERIFEYLKDRGVAFIDIEAIVRAAVGEDVHVADIGIRESYLVKSTGFIVFANANPRLSDNELSAILADSEQIAISKGFTPEAGPNSK